MAIVNRTPDSFFDAGAAVATHDAVREGFQRAGGEHRSLVARSSSVVEDMATKESRVVIRCRPYATFAQPPRHLHRNDQDEKITHWVSATVPWDAEDLLQAGS